MGDLRSFFAAGKTAPIGNTRAGTDSPNGGIGRSARHDAQPSAFSIRTASSRAPTSSATPDTTFPPHGRKNPPRPEIRRPGTSFARKIRLAREIRRPETSFARKIRRPGTSFVRKSAGPIHVPAVYRRPPFIPPGTRPVRLCPAPLSFTGTFYAPFPSPQHVPRIAPPAEWHAP